MKIMFVCTGNTCRSPMAEAAAKSIFPKEEYEIISRGLSVFESTPASENAVKTVEKAGLDLSGHMSKQISEEDIKTSDIIFTMTNAHKQMLSAVCNKLNKPIFTLGEFTGFNTDIMDPYGGDLAVYEKCFNEILEYVKAASKIIIK